MEATNTKFVWWKNGIIYHIYVRSFFDSNDDGIGDLQGIIQKLDYLSSLGVDAIWLSPIFKSPHCDWGYDIEDYLKIDKDYGTNADFLELLEKGHEKGIKIILDMVLNHTSNKHPWFLESKSSLNNPKRDWYIWQKKINNWRNFIGEKAWTRDKKTQEYYLHSFLKEQPDLNWRNREVKSAMFNYMKYWLDIGVDGFRLDVINFIVKDKKFRNNPNFIAQVFRRKKIYSRNRKTSLAILSELRSLIDQYKERVIIGEIYTLPPGEPHLVKSYSGNGQDRLHLVLDFSLMYTPWNPKKYARTLQKSHKNTPNGGWQVINMSNHDILRSFSKHAFYREEKAKLMNLILLTSFGTPIIFYGEEIGMTSENVKRKEIRDKIGRKYWPFYTGRDKLRKPMQWNQGYNAGFSKATPWLPINKKTSKVNVAKQSEDKNSIYNLFKELITIRKNNEIFQKGSWKLFNCENKKILAYKRSYNDNELITLLNFSRRKQKIQVQFSSMIFSTHNKINNNFLAPFEGRILKVFDSELN